MSELLRAFQQLPTPALIYDLQGLERTIDALLADTEPLPDRQLCFAVKANHCPELLSYLAGRGLGADVASPRELELAAAAGFRQLHATAPGLTLDFIEALSSQGVVADFSSASNLAQYAPRLRGKDVGLRLRLPIASADADEPGSTQHADSRFGVDPRCPELQRTLQQHELRVTQLHVHAGEIGSCARGKRLFAALQDWLTLFPDVTSLNLGGGLSELYGKREDARALWQFLGQALRQLAAGRGRPLATVVEPGMLLTSHNGYLVTSVIALDTHPSGRALATVDASAFNLVGWVPPSVVYVTGGGEPAPHDIAGNTCFERDYFIRGAQVPTLRVGSRVVFDSMGAYCASMARRLHGAPIPRESIV